MPGSCPAGPASSPAAPPLQQHPFRGRSECRFCPALIPTPAVTVPPRRPGPRCSRQPWLSLTVADRGATLETAFRLSPARALKGDGMECPRCQQENPAAAHFCMRCGTRLTLTCAKCNTQLPSGAAFCFACGQAMAVAAGEQRFTSPEAYTPRHLAEKILISKAALEGERKQVTVLFADLKGSMELVADRDAEVARK